MEPCNILPGNCSAHGVNNSKRFGKCAFRLKKGAVVRKLLHHKVEKVPKNGWWGGGGVMWKWCAPNSATKCMKLLTKNRTLLKRRIILPIFSIKSFNSKAVKIDVINEVL